MVKELVYQTIYSKIMNGQGEFDENETAGWSMPQRSKLFCWLMNICKKDHHCLDRVLRYAGGMVPYLDSRERYACLADIIHLLHQSEDLYGKDVYDLLDFSVVRSLQPLELISLSNMLTNYMHEGKHAMREASVWGLIRVIPYLHSVNQKEFAHDIYVAARDPKMTDQILNGLTFLIYSLDQVHRSGMMLFFVESLKGSEPVEQKYFILELIKKTAGAIPERERVRIADSVAPLLYFADKLLVKKAIEYFAEVMNLLPKEERFHFGELVTGLIDHEEFYFDVVRAIEKITPFLQTDREKEHFENILKAVRQRKSQSEQGANAQFSSLWHET